MKHIKIEGMSEKQCQMYSDDGHVLYEGTLDQTKLKDVLQPILKEYPEVFVHTKNIKPSNQDWLHIFKVKRDDDESVRAFIKTHDEVSDPFRNRRLYQMVNPQSTVSFRSIDL